MQTSPRRTEGTAPIWNSWLVGASLMTDPRYVAYRLRRRWARLAGRPPAAESLQEPSSAPTPQPGRTRDLTAAESLAGLEVDLVYLWVSGQEPAHREKRNQWLRQYELDPVVFNPDVRYVEDDELRYSLRSVELFLPWIRKIFIVTDSQVPAWLDLAHPRVEVVDHAQMIPDARWLPTFNSKVIGNHIHNIPGLAEHFIYANDDCFFGQPCWPEDFFAAMPSPGGRRVAMKVMFSEYWIAPAHRIEDPLLRLWAYGCNNLKVMLELRRPWRKIRYVDFHQAQPMLRSELARATRDFARAHRRTSASRFRNAHDVNFLSVARHRAVERGNAVPGFLPRTLFPTESDLSAYTRETLPPLFCVNGGPGDGSACEDRMLRRLFPRRSGFELDPALAPPLSSLADRQPPAPAPLPS